MRTVATQRNYYCGIDLHAKNFYACIVTSDGRCVSRKRLPNDFKAFIEFIRPYRESIAIALEATFNWYWFIDGCRAYNIEVYLGHSYYMKAIYCDKRKNDRLDAEKIANLLRAGLLPLAHACAASTRSVRDLLRRRNSLVYMRSELLGYTRKSFYQQGDILTTPAEIKNKRTRMATVARFTDEDVRFGAEIEMEIVTELDTKIRRLENHILEKANIHYQQDIAMLQKMPGVGPILSMTVLYETDCIDRFDSRQDYSSYCRLVRPGHTSNGKVVAIGNRKCGNAHLKWAYMEMVGTCASASDSIGQIYTTLKTKYHPLKARAIMANHFCTVIYYMLKRKQHFDINRYCKSFLEVDSLAPKAGELQHAA